MNQLNENSVLDFYLSTLNNDNIYFLKNKPERKQHISDLIVKLKLATSMNEKINVAKILWKSLFEVSMSSIDANKDGYDTLFDFFDNYVDFEELIFASDSFYRDHTLHCLWVYFLGEYLVKSNEFSMVFDKLFENTKEVNKIKCLIESLNMNSTLNDLYTLYCNMVQSANYNDAQRCIIALTHDLGYPLKKIDKINKSIKNILPTFSINNYDEFNFNFNNVDQNFISSFINFLSYDLIFTFNNNKVSSSSHNCEKIITEVFDTSNENFLDFSKEKLLQLNDEELHVITEFFDGDLELHDNPSVFWRYSNDFEAYRHGIMSAFLLIKNIGSFNTIDLHYCDKSNINKKINYIDISLKQSILKAISDHTSPGYKIKNIDSPSAFLALVDELEEFSRISRANQNREYIEEFCSTTIYMEDSWFNIDFTFENTSIDNLNPERAFKGRCERFLTLFDIPNLNKDLKIRLRCIGNLPNNKNVYTLEIANKFVSIRVNNSEIDIPKYLNSNNFYTSEEYKNLS